MRGCFALIAGFLSLSRYAVETRTHNARALLAEPHDELQQITLCEFGLPRVVVRCDEIVRVVDTAFDGDAVCAHRVSAEATALRADANRKLSDIFYAGSDRIGKF